MAGRERSPVPLCTTGIPRPGPLQGQRPGFSHPTTHSLGPLPRFWLRPFPLPLFLPVFLERSLLAASRLKGPMDPNTWNNRPAAQILIGSSSTFLWDENGAMKIGVLEFKASRDHTSSTLTSCRSGATNATQAPAQKTQHLELNCKSRMCCEFSGSPWIWMD